MTNQITQEETIKEGKALFGQFIVDEIEDEGLVTPNEIRAEIEELCTQNVDANPTWAKAGQNLRRCANAFAKSKERKEVHRQAVKLTIDDGQITREKFIDLLSELLKGGITREKIVVLFFFCSDVAIEILKQKGVELCQRLIQWSLEFITQRVCSWVQEHGGWGAVFNSTMIFVGGAAIVVVVGLICYFGYKKFIKNRC